MGSELKGNLCDCGGKQFGPRVSVLSPHLVDSRGEGIGTLKVLAFPAINAVAPPVPRRYRLFRFEAETLLKSETRTLN
jgi:hypothetical protein